MSGQDQSATRIGARQIIAGIAVVAGIAIYFSPGVAGMSDPAMRAAGLTVAAIGLYATGAVPEYFTSILFMFVAVLTAVAPPNVVFSGFHSSAVWLVFGGLVLGLGVQSSGLGARTVRLMLRHFPSSYFGTVAALVAVGAVLAYFIPSAMGRVMLLLPIVLALADKLGFAPGSKPHSGLVLAATGGTMFSAFAILPGNVPNMGLIGAAESIYRITFTYGEYWLLNYPVMGLAGMIFIPFLITFLFGEAPKPTQAEDGNGGWARDERMLLAIVALALALWSTDFLHHISPAWIAMGAALLCLAPRVGVMPASVITNKINFGPWFFVAGIIGLGAVATHTGLGDAIAKGALGWLWLEPGGGFGNYAAIVGLNIAVGTITTLPASPGILAPLADNIAQASGWPLKSVLLAQVPSWMSFPFPYQAPPVVVAVALGSVSMSQALRFFGAYFLFAFLALLPLQYFWGHALGYYP